MSKRDGHGRVSEAANKVGRPTLTAFVLVIAAACVHTMEPLSPGEPALRVELSIGDTVRVLTKDSQRRSFRIDSIGQDALEGKDPRGRDVTTPYEEIVFIERRSFSSARTAGLTAAGSLATIILIITVDGAVPGLPGEP